MGSEYHTAMEEFDVEYHTSRDREWDVGEDLLVLDPPYNGCTLGSEDRSRGTFRISSDGYGRMVRRVPVRVVVE